MNKKLSEKDKKDWEDFLLKNEKLPNKDLKSIKKKIFREKSIDLHGSSLDKANELIEKFIKSSYEEGVLKLIVVTGKGIHSDNEKDPYVSKDLSILKYSVPEFIKNNKELMKKIIKIQDATIADGGSGAFYIFLKNKYT